jgi:hypothetical protein
MDAPCTLPRSSITSRCWAYLTCCTGASAGVKEADISRIDLAAPTIPRCLLRPTEASLRSQMGLRRC